MTSTEKNPCVSAPQGSDPETTKQPRTRAEILALREGFIAGRSHATMSAYVKEMIEQQAARRYPLPKKIEYNTAVVDGLEYRVRDGVVEFRDPTRATAQWETSTTYIASYVRRRRAEYERDIAGIATIEKLMACPTREVEDTGA